MTVKQLLDLALAPYKGEILARWQMSVHVSSAGRQLKVEVWRRNADKPIIHLVG